MVPANRCEGERRQRGRSVGAMAVRCTVRVEMFSSDGTRAERVHAGKRIDVCVGRGDESGWDNRPMLCIPVQPKEVRHRGRARRCWAFPRVGCPACSSVHLFRLGAHVKRRTDCEHNRRLAAQAAGHSSLAICLAGAKCLLESKASPNSPAAALHPARRPRWLVCYVKGAREDNGDLHGGRAEDTPGAENSQQMHAKSTDLPRLSSQRSPCYNTVCGVTHNPTCLSCRSQPKRPAPARQVLISDADPDSLSGLCAAIDAVLRPGAAHLPRRLPLAPVNCTRSKRTVPSPDNAPQPGPSKFAAAAAVPVPFAGRCAGASFGASGASDCARSRSDGARAPPPPLRGASRGSDFEDLYSSLSAAQAEAADLVKAGLNVFITGSAGTGKSHLLRVACLGGKLGATFVTAPTGLAASEMTCGAAGSRGGVTLNAFAGIGQGREQPEQVLARVLRSRAARDRWRRCERLVIDEVSMLDGRLFDALEVLRRS